VWKQLYKKLLKNLHSASLPPQSLEVFALIKLMKQLNEALKEFNKTNPILKPRLCLNESTGMYLVTLGFSKQYCTKQNLKVIL
jgi:hypothetical protein